MLIKHAQVYQGQELVWDNLTAELNGRTLVVRNRGIPRIGNFELRLEDGTRRIMRSGAPATARVDANAAYFTLNAIWK
jgi:hypothetical protein